MKQKPPSNILAFDVKKDYEYLVTKEASRGFIVNWLRFEYVRRNPLYREDWQEFLALPGVHHVEQNYVEYDPVDIRVNKNASGFVFIENDPSIQDYEKATHDFAKLWDKLVSKWEIIQVCDPDRPLPRLSYPINATGLSTTSGLHVAVYKNDELIHEWEWIQNEDGEIQNRKREKLDPKRFKLEYIIEREGQPPTPMSTYKLILNGLKPYFQMWWINPERKPNALIFDDRRRVELKKYHKLPYQLKVADISKTTCKCDGYADYPTTQVILNLTKWNFTNVPTKEQLAEQRVKLGLAHYFESFKPWQPDPPSELLVEWDESTWQLVAINRKAEIKKIREAFENVIADIRERQRKKPTFEDGVKHLWWYDLHHICYWTYKKIAEEANANTEKHVEKTLNKVRKLIDGRYRNIR